MIRPSLSRCFAFESKNRMRPKRRELFLLNPSNQATPRGGKPSDADSLSLRFCRASSVSSLSLSSLATSLPRLTPARSLSLFPCYLATASDAGTLSLSLSFSPFCHSLPRPLSATASATALARLFFSPLLRATAGWRSISLSIGTTTACYFPLLFFRGFVIDIEFISRLY